MLPPPTTSIYLSCIFYALEQPMNGQNRLIQGKHVYAYIANSNNSKKLYLTIARSGERTELPS